jgi:hypothetical protein
MASNAVDPSTFVFTSLLAGDCLTSKLKVKVKVTLRLAVYDKSVRLCVKPLETHDKYFFFKWTFAVIVLMQHPLWREDGSVIYNCCWLSPEQSFSGPSPARLMTTFYCLRFETPPTWRARSTYLYPPGTGRLGCIPRHWVPFSSSSTTRWVTVEYSNPPPYGNEFHTRNI